MKRNFTLTYLLLAIAQMVICNYFNFSPLLTLSILPVLVFCLPVRIGPMWAMLIAFATGLAVDWLSEGVLGLNALALVPVAFLRRPVFSFIFGEELLVRKDDFSFAKYGAGKLCFGILIMQALFLLVYILADGGRIRPIYNFIRFGLSLAVGTLLSLIIANILTRDVRR